MTTHFSEKAKASFVHMFIVGVRGYLFLLKFTCLSAALVFGQSTVADELALTIENGEDIYTVNCVLCHGAKGEGDGRMAKVITDPPPANLTKSTRSKDYLSKMVTDGGDAMGRSPKMPAWGGELSKQQVNAVVNYIYSLRR